MSAETQDPSPATRLAMHLRVGDRRGAKISKEGRAFNKRVQDIESLRAQITAWQAAAPALAQRVANEITPQLARLRAARIELAMLLHRAIEAGRLTKRDKTKAREIVCWHLAQLLDAERDETLLALHDHYAERGYDEQRSVEEARLRAMAADLLGYRDLEDTASMGMEEIARIVAESMREALEPPPRRAARPDKTAVRREAQEELRARLAQGAGEAVRDIYRKLASELHPDREQDTVERARKTALMQEANQAYAANDLLTLLGLQMQVAQLEPASLNSLARERLLQFNHLLDKQYHKLCEVLAELTEPYIDAMPDSSRTPTPQAVDREITREARALKRAVRLCEGDVLHFSDVRRIRRELADYRLGDLVAREEAFIDDLTSDFEPPSPPPRRRR